METCLTVLIAVRWRDLPQRFWITYCVNAVLVYLSLPIYRMHFGFTDGQLSIQQGLAGGGSGSDATFPAFCAGPHITKPSRVLTKPQSVINKSRFVLQALSPPGR